MIRRAIALLLLVCVVAHPCDAPATIAGSALLELGHDHSHTASLVREGGHLHLVLSHDHHSAGASAAHGAVGESDHVFELTCDAAVHGSARRADDSSELVFTVTRVSPPVPVFVAVTHSPLEPRTADVGRLRTVVLRL